MLRVDYLNQFSDFRVSPHDSITAELAPRMVIVVGLGLPGQGMYRRLERRLQFGSDNSDEQDDKHNLLEEKSRRRQRFSNRPFSSNIRLPMT